MDLREMAWFDLDEKSESKREYLARVKYNKIVARQAESFMDIVGEELLPGIQYRIVTTQGFNAISVIEYLSSKHQILEVYIAVYRMNQQAINKLIQFIDNNNTKCFILLSSFFRENHNYEKWSRDLVAYSRSKKNTRVTFAWTHAKVFLARTKDQKHIVFEGSGNLSDNARIEQYLIEDNKEVYEFHKDWITKTVLIE